MAAKTIAMTTLQKALIGTALAVAAGTGIYEAHQASRVRQQNQSLENQQGALAAQLDALQQEHDTLRKETGQSQSNQNTDEVLKLRGEVSRLRQQLAESKTARQAVDDPFAQSVQALSAKAVELNQHLEQMPEKKIPELHFLTEHDWLNAASSANFQTDADVRKALRRLRNVAKSKMPMGWALHGYTQAHRGE